MFFQEGRSPLERLGEDEYGTVYLYMPLNKDSFIHFTTLERAKEIIESGKIMVDSPHQGMGAVGAFAVSTVYGYYVPTVQTTHIDGDVVGLYFTTDTMPEIGYPEETIWKKDIALKESKIVSNEKAISMLMKTSDNDPEFVVSYNRDKAKQTVEKF